MVQGEVRDLRGRWPTQTTDAAAPVDLVRFASARDAHEVKALADVLLLLLTRGQGPAIPAR